MPRQSGGTDVEDIKIFVERLKSLKAGRRNNYLATLLVAALILALVYQALIEPRVDPGFAVSSRNAVEALQSVQSMQAILKANAATAAAYTAAMQQPATFMTGIAINVDDEAGTPEGCAKLLKDGIADTDVRLLRAIANGNDLTTLLEWTRRFAISMPKTTDVEEYFSYAHAVAYPDVQVLSGLPSINPPPEGCAPSRVPPVGSDFSRIAETMEAASRVAALRPNYGMKPVPRPNTSFYLKDQLPPDQWQQTTMFLPNEPELATVASRLMVYCRTNGVEYCSPDSVTALLDEQTRPDIVKSPYLPIDLNRIDALMILSPVQAALFFMFYVFAVRARLLSEVIGRRGIIPGELDSSDFFDAFTERYRPISAESREERISAVALTLVLLLSLAVPVVSQLMALVSILEYDFNTGSGADSFRRLVFWSLSLPLSGIGLISTGGISVMLILRRLQSVGRRTAGSLKMARKSRSELP
jgi:hypothetical protein